MEDAPRKFYRLTVGREVRLRYGYFLKCHDIVKDPETGEITELRCTYDPETRSGHAPDGRKVRATIHWVSGDHSVPAEVRLYDRLFDRENPSEVRDFHTCLNPDSLKSLTGCRLEPSLEEALPGTHYQFERLGYFCVDAEDSRPGKLVFNRTVTLRDAWARMKSRG